MLPLSDPDIRRRRFPIVNISLIALCAIVFIYELTLDQTDRMLLFYRFGMIPSELTRGISYHALSTPTGNFDIATPFSDWITPFTSMFLHGDWMHFSSNMLFLWVFGKTIEDRFGHVPYLLLYIGAGLAASWMQIAVNMHSEVPTIGASGAIAGVLGAYFLLYPFSRIRTLVVFIFIVFVRIPAFLLLGFWILLQFVEGLGSLEPSTQTGGVAYWAHIGGFIVGVMVAALVNLFTPARRGHRPSSWRER
jgi:membrane associated rhomboid family serine protease